jgi:hypothetical protein
MEVARSAETPESTYEITLCDREDGRLCFSETLVSVYKSAKCHYQKTTICRIYGFGFQVNLVFYQRYYT